MPIIDSPPLRQSAMKVSTFPTKKGNLDLVETTTNLYQNSETGEYFSQKPGSADFTPLTIRPKRPSLRVRFDHLLNSEIPPIDERHPNEMYSKDRVTTPHPAQRILYRSTPPSRSSSWNGTPVSTPQLVALTRLQEAEGPLAVAGAKVAAMEEKAEEMQIQEGGAVQSPIERHETPHPVSAKMLLRGDSISEIEDQDCSYISSLAENPDMEILSSPVASSNFFTSVGPTSSPYNIRGNSWVFDEAERLSIERARGLRIIEIPASLGGSPSGKRGSGSGLSRLLAMTPTPTSNGGDDARGLGRGWRTAKRKDTGDPRMPAPAGKEEESKDGGDRPKIPRRNPDREKVYMMFSERQKGLEGMGMGLKSPNVMVRSQSNTR